MTFLRILLSRCTAPELHKLKLQPLKGNEYEVLLETIKHCNNPDCSDEYIQHKLQLSKSYFDKINSVLLNKCTTILAGSNSYEDAFSLYLEKDISDLVKHELKIREKQILKSGTKDEIAHFYYIAFQNLRRIPASDYNDDLAETTANKYLLNKEQCTEADELEIRAMLEVTRAFIKAVTGEMKKYEPFFVEKMKAISTQIENKPYYNAHFHYQLAWANYYDYYTSNFPDLVNALKTALTYYEKAKGTISETYKIYAITKLAKAYCHGSHFEEALKIYQEAFDLFGNQLTRNPYHPTMYAIVSIINGKYAEAEVIMNNNLQHLLNSEKPGTLDFDIYRTYAILYMNQAKFDKAFLYLEEALKFRRTGISLLGDILLRMVHNAFFVLSGDLATAKATLARNFKFLSSKENDPMVQEYTSYFKMLKQIIRYREGKKLPKDFAEQLAPFRQGIMKLYGDLLDKMVD